MQAVITTKGQVTIPKALRDRLGLRKGTVLEFEVEAGRLVARKAVRDDPIAAVRGILRDPRPADAILAELRGEEP
jgi:AbrB family looped-hinge helix DNA binding protein